MTRKTWNKRQDVLGKINTVAMVLIGIGLFSIYVTTIVIINSTRGLVAMSLIFVMGVSILVMMSKTLDIRQDIYNYVKTHYRG